MKDKNMHKAIILGLLAAVMFCSGCAVNTIRSSVLDEHSISPQIWKNSELVVTNTNSPGLGFFLAGLSATRLFRDVRYDDFPPENGALIVRTFLDTIHEIDHITCAIPHISIFTIFIVPVVCERQHSITFTVETAGTGTPIPIAVDFVEEHAVGWVALFYLMSANWSTEHSEPYGRVLTAALAAKAIEINSAR